MTAPTASPFNPPHVHLNLSKCLDPADLLPLGPDLAIVDRYPIGHEQHPMRRWEYAMAVRAVREWALATGRLGNPDRPLTALDVGGAGSTLPDILKSMEIPTTVIDPKVTKKLEEVLAGRGTTDLPTSAPIVTCISTLEHVPEAEYAGFLGSLAAVVEPVGLLFLTSDIWGKPDDEPDEAHFHWMRERIYTVGRWKELAGEMCRLGFQLFGFPSWEYRGDHVTDYSFASLALVKVTG